MLNLDVSDHQRWLLDVNHNELSGNWDDYYCFSVPNTVYLDKGIRFWYEVSPLGKLSAVSMLWVLADRDAIELKFKGFHVVVTESVNEYQISEHLRAEDIYAYKGVGSDY